MLPDELVDLLATDDIFGGESTSQAFPFLTVADSGHPHVALLSSAQIGVSDDGSAILVSVAGRETCANLDARGLATVVAVRGVTAYYAKCQVLARTEVQGRAGYALQPLDVKLDRAGVELVPLGFHFKPELADAERWVVDAAVLADLRTRC
ncbi:hypothetical protein GCM10027062_31620 [Nocardioides hungaricus]